MRNEKKIPNPPELQRPGKTARAALVTAKPAKTAATCEARLSLLVGVGE